MFLAGVDISKTACFMTTQTFSQEVTKFITCDNVTRFDGIHIHIPVPNILIPLPLPLPIPIPIPLPISILGTGIGILGIGICIGIGIGTYISRAGNSLI